MDTLIIQIGGKHGRLTELVKSSGPSISIGRGFSNDMVVSDPYVAPEQIRFFKNSDQWLLEVLDGTNPVLLNGTVVMDERPELKSGDKITIGRMHLSVFSGQDEVEETRKLVFSNWLYHGRFKTFIPIVVLLAVCALQAFSEYQQLATRFKWGKFASNALMLAFVIICWAGLWALIGRLLRHQHHFYTQVLFTALGVGIFIVFDVVPEYIEYISNSHLFGEILRWCLALAALSLLFKFNLYLASNLRHSTITSVCVSAFLLLFIYGMSNFDKDDFDTTPEYSNVLKIPLVQASPNRSLENYIRDYDDLFIALKKESSE